MAESRDSSSTGYQRKRGRKKKNTTATAQGEGLREIQLGCARKVWNQRGGLCSSNWKEKSGGVNRHKQAASRNFSIIKKSRAIFKLRKSAGTRS